MKLIDKNIGDIVKISENGSPVNYIIVHKGLPSDMYDESCNGVWVLRETTHSNRQWETSSNKYDYGKSWIKQWLETTFVNTIDEKIKAVIKEAKIPCYTNGAVQSGTDGLPCKAFLLSAIELGCSKVGSTNLLVDGGKLSYFSDNNSRKAKDSTDTVVAWWLRSPYLYNANDLVINTMGNCSYSNATTNNGVRPAFILPYDLTVLDDGSVVTNNAPTITANLSGDLGEISDRPDFKYTVSDEDSDSVSATEFYDGELARTTPATLDEETEFERVNAENWQTVTNGRHTLKIIANDGTDNSEPYIVTFDKQIRTASVSLKTPLPADDVIKVAVLNIAGEFPLDARLEVLVTNNGNDENPAWEDMTEELKRKINHIFANQTAENGFAFNFKVNVSRGESDEQGYLINIGGAFE